LPSKSCIGIDPSVITVNDAKELQKELDSIGSKLVFLEQNPVDQIRSDRPNRPAKPIKVHPIEYAGKSVKSKLIELRQSTNNTSVVVSALDEIAWLLNLRGSDVHCCPVFFSYVVATKDTTTLYIQPSAKLSDQVQNHLKEAGVYIKHYDQIMNDLAAFNEPFLIDPSSTNMSILQALGNVKIGVLFYN
jgi:Xaa-Pro aminopeptidase